MKIKQKWLKSWDVELNNKKINFQKYELNGNMFVLVFIAHHCPVVIWFYLRFLRATVSAVNCLVVLPPLFIILAMLSYLANKLIDCFWLIEMRTKNDAFQVHWELNENKYLQTEKKLQ